VDFLIPFVVFVVLMAIGYFMGGANERKHVADIEVREQRHQTFPVTDLKTTVGMPGTTGGALVLGQVVIASDYLKTWLAGLRNLFGGEMKSFQTLLDRARREARLRMVESAISQGAVGIINVRFETSQIGQGSGNRGLPMSEVLCYGTAVFPQGS